MRCGLLLITHSEQRTNGKNSEAETERLSICALTQLPHDAAWPRHRSNHIDSSAVQLRSDLFIQTPLDPSLFFDAGNHNILRCRPPSIMSPTLPVSCVSLDSVIVDNVVVLGGFDNLFIGSYASCCAECDPFGCSYLPGK